MQWKTIAHHFLQTDEFPATLWAIATIEDNP